MVRKFVKEWDSNCSESYLLKKCKRRKKETLEEIKKRKKMLRKNKIKRNLQKLSFSSLKSNATELF